MRIRHFFTAAFIFISPLPVLADCSVFLAYNADGSYHADIAQRVEDALTCDQWAPEFDQNTLNHAQGFVLQTLLSEHRNDEAVATASLYFEDATARYERAAVNPDALDILADNGRLYARLTSHVQQVGMLATDVQSTLTNCEATETLDALLALMEDHIQRHMDRYNARVEATRLDIEQRLRDYSLEEWQEFYPDATTIEDIRNQEDIQRALAPDMQAALYSRIDRLFMSMFTTTVRVEGGNAEQCLADAFSTFSVVEGMTPQQRSENFPSVAFFMQENLLDK
nr:hypothetical protein [uncultured Celeribacter sp.]